MFLLLSGGETCTIRRKEAFSLIDALLSVGIAMVLVTVVFFSVLKWLEGNRLESGAEKVAILVSYAQQQAISESRNCYIQIDTNSPHAYTYFDVFSKKSFVLPDGLIFKYVDIHPPVFYFNYLGTPSVGCTITIEDVTTRKDIYVVVAAVTGRVRVSYGHP